MYGTAGEHVVISQLLNAGFDVFRDVTDSCSADLVVKYRDKFKTIQVKTTEDPSKGSIFVRNWRQFRKAGKVMCEPYTGNEFDVLAYHILDRNITLWIKISDLVEHPKKSGMLLQRGNQKRSGFL